jgi:hypothetical protein
MGNRFRIPVLQFRHEYFIILLPLFFVLHGFNEYAGKIPALKALQLFGLYGLLVASTSLVFFFLFRSFRKAALFTFGAGCFYFFYGSFHDWLKNLLPGTLVVKYSVLLPLALIGFAGLYILIKKSGSSFSRFVYYLNLLFLCLVGVEVVVAVTMKPPHQQLVQAATSANPVTAALTPCATCLKEDIHLIVLDEYAGATQLKEVFGFDNTPFYNVLRARGFRVIENARSNYNYTPVSLASMFSLDYLQGLQKWPEFELIHIGKRIMKENIFVDFLISQGYDINNISIFDLRGQAAYKDEFKSGTSQLTDHTFWNRLKKDLGYHMVTTLKSEVATRKVIEGMEKDAYENLKRMDTLLKRVENRRSQPQFYYTHLMMPHVPYVLDRNGRSVGMAYYSDPDRDKGIKRGYLEYLRYTNKQVQALVDTLIKRSAKPPVIILMGDHGFRDHTVPPKYHFMTLHAVYVPDGQYNGYNDGLTNVNQLRLLLNNRLGQKLPLLKDSTTFLGWPGMEVSE